MLEPINCPECQRPMVEIGSQSKSATKYEDCIRRCENCKVGASNAKKNPTFIYKNIEANVPKEFKLDGELEPFLRKALNEYNRENKLVKFGFSTSEDALTWIFFSYFVVFSNLDVLQKLLSFEQPIKEILLWGNPIINKSNISWNSSLKSIGFNLGETPLRLSEPDCIIISDEEVKFIEVKLKSENDLDNDSKKFLKYNKSFAYIDFSTTIKSGLYELTRNWTIGTIFSGNKNFQLINLGPRKLFSKEKRRQLDLFKLSLVKPNNFILLSWEDILESELFHNLDQWFTKDVQKRLNR